MKYYIYILYSSTYDKYYIGYTSNYIKRLENHNTSNHTTFTSKYRPWVISAVFLVGNDVSVAIKLERYIKKQKSKILLQKLSDVKFTPNGVLAQLVRVPHVRD